jgi:hypothetical protein
MQIPLDANQAGVERTTGVVRQRVARHREV